jgi:hypothetical protein
MLQYLRHYDCDEEVTEGILEAASLERTPGLAEDEDCCQEQHRSCRHVRRVQAVERSANQNQSQKREHGPQEDSDKNRLPKDRHRRRENDKPERMSVTLDTLANIENWTVTAEEVTGVASRDHGVVTYPSEGDH